MAMSRKTVKRSMSDAYTKTRAKGAKPSKVSLIVDGVKYKAGQSPVRVCPAGSARRVPQ
jgi:hypothetical protein